VRPAAEADRVLGQLKATVRRNYSSPGIHAAGMVARVLSDAALRRSWEPTSPHMRERILAMRRSLHGVLSAKCPGRDFGYFLGQRGMFSYTGLSAGRPAAQVPDRDACAARRALRWRWRPCSTSTGLRSGRMVLAWPDLQHRQRRGRARPSGMVDRAHGDAMKDLSSGVSPATGLAASAASNMRATSAAAATSTARALAAAPQCPATSSAALALRSATST
jgi:hypothetical protein